MKNTTKSFWVLAVFLGLTQSAYACGVCNMKILVNIMPIFIVFYIFSPIYSLIVYVIMRIKKIATFGKFLSITLKLFGVWVLCGILTLGFPSGPIPFLISAIYCFFVPNRYYKRLTSGREKEEAYVKTRRILTKIRKMALLLVVVLGLVYQIIAIVNISRNPELLKIKESNKTIQPASSRR